MLYKEHSGDDLIQHSQSNNECSQTTQSTITKEQAEDFSKEIMDLPFDNVANNTTASITEYVKESVNLTNVFAKWEPINPEYTLSGVSLTIVPETIVAIIGPVGSGKSSILQAILGELPIESGTLEINGKISYASQEPWLFSASIRQNILFGLPFERERYKKVVKVCALERDFTLFGNGDKTIVGERGASLSGGQKARINLARAVYRQSSIYILDDPLSAVDTHVGRHLFEECIKKYLREKIVILVTHQLQYLQSADQIVIMDHGKISAVGSYESLSKSGLDFAKLLASSEKEENEENTLSRSNSKTIYRRQSETSVNSEAAEQTTVNEDQMLVAENKTEGTIGFDVYKKYLKASGGLVMCIFLTLMCVLAQGLASAGDYFLTYWVSKQQIIPELNSFFNASNSSQEIELNRSTRDINPDWNTFVEKISSWWTNIIEDEYFDIYLFSLITILTVVITLGRSFLFFNVIKQYFKFMK